MDNSGQIDEVGFYVNKNTTDHSTDYENKKNNLYVRNNKIYLIDKYIDENNDGQYEYVEHRAPSSDPSPARTTRSPLTSKGGASESVVIPPSAGSGAASSRFIRLSFDDDGIDEADNAARRVPTAGVYDLQGRHVATAEEATDGSWRSHVPPGLYIVNGRKVILPRGVPR